MVVLQLVETDVGGELQDALDGRVCALQDGEVHLSGDGVAVSGVKVDGGRHRAGGCSRGGREGRGDRKRGGERRQVEREDKCARCGLFVTAGGGRWRRCA